MDRQGCGRIEIGFDTSDVEMVPISWRRFFDIFEANQLAFCGQRLWTTEGHVMRLPKLVSRGPDLDLLEGPPVPAPELAATDPVV